MYFGKNELISQGAKRKKPAATISSFVICLMILCHIYLINQIKVWLECFKVVAKEGLLKKTSGNMALEHKVSFGRLGTFLLSALGRLFC